MKIVVTLTCIIAAAGCSQAIKIPGKSDANSNKSAAGGQGDATADRTNNGAAGTGTGGTENAAACTPKSVLSFPSNEDIQNAAKQFSTAGELKTNVVDAGGYPHIRIVPAVAKAGEIVRIIWKPHVANCNVYRKWPQTCDLDVPMCAKYAGSYVFNGFGGVNSIPFISLKEGRLLGFEVASTSGKLLYWRKASDEAKPIPSFLAGDPLKLNKFQAPASVGEVGAIPGFVDSAALKGDGLNEAQYKALPKCGKEKNNNFSDDMLFITVWQINADASANKIVHGTIGAGDEYSTGISSAGYTILPGTNDTLPNSCY